MRFNIGDYIKFDKELNLLKLYGKIIDIVGKHYKFEILSSTRPITKNNKRYFLIDGKISEYIVKVSKEEVDNSEYQFKVKESESV